MLRALILFLFVVACASAEADAPPSDTGSSDTGSPAIGETGGMCGGIAGFACSSSAEFCAMDAGVCANTADAAGVCRRKPEICTMEYNPVCGCDGKTYGNGCSAASNGVNVAHAGACKDE